MDTPQFPTKAAAPQLTDSKPRPFIIPAEPSPAKRDEYILACFIIFALYLSYSLGGFLGEGRGARPVGGIINLRPKTVFAEAPPLAGEYARSIYLRLDSSCLRRTEGKVVAGSTPGCRDLGTAQLEDGTRATIVSDSRDAGSVWLALFDGPTELRGGRLQLAALQNVYDDWFGLRLQGAQDALFATASVGEGTITHHRRTADGWQPFDVWGLVKDRFPDAIQPAFDIELRTDGHVVATERNGVGGSTYTEADKQRAKTRIRYVLKRGTADDGRESYLVESEGTIPR